LILALVGKASFNPYVGGDTWQPYIGNLETGLWLFSFMDDRSSPELENITSDKQKEQRHTIRVSNITRFLRDKLSRFPKQKQDNNTSEIESFTKDLHKEAQKLYVEPNGKELLSSLGEIYVSKAQANLNRFSISNRFSSLFNNVRFTTDLVSGFIAAKTKSGMNQEEISKLVWRLSRSEINSIVCETCDKVLDNKNNNADDENESNHLANSLRRLGQVWLEVSKQSKM
jgi:hypothetical protein